MLPRIPPQGTADLTRRLRALADDLDRIAAGQGPSEGELSDAPLLTGWGLVAEPTFRMAGHVEEHPNCGPGSVMTSPLWHVDRSLAWGRTLSRLYRLGVPAGNDVQ